MKSKGLFAKMVIFILVFLIYLPIQSSGELLVGRKNFTTLTDINEFVPGEIIVKFKPMATMAKVARVNSDYSTSVLYTSPYAGFKRIKIPPDKTVSEMVKLYRKNPLVEYAEPNYRRHAHWVPNDPDYPLQWHFSQMNVPSAWDIERGGKPSVIVAVLDSGVAYEDYETYKKAPDLAGTNFVPGYDFVNNDSHPNDDNGHGTHVTGTIAQTTNNNIGVAGIAFNCSIMPVKILDADGEGTVLQEADGIYYAVDNGAKVINLSIGGPSGGTTEYDAVKYAYDNDVIIVAAAGNHLPEGISSIDYPAAYDECIAVGAVRYDKTRAYYSNYGTGIELMAPGGDTSVDQNSDKHPDGVLQQTFSGGDPTNFDYYFWQGTSMATPHITGIIALMLSHGTSGIEDIRNILHSTAEDLGVPGYDTGYGYGLANASLALSPEYSDLTITSITSTPDFLNIGEEISVTINFANYGNANTGKFRIDMYEDLNTAPKIGDIGDYFAEISGISAGVTSSYTFTYSYATGGTKQIWAQIDTNNLVTEINENNNIFGFYSIDIGSPPEELTLSEVYNYPNPANTAARVHFKLGAGANLTIKIYTISGELVKTLVENKPYSPGVYSETWKLGNEGGEKVARGIYILLVKASNSAKTLVKTNKIAVVK